MATPKITIDTGKPAEITLGTRKRNAVDLDVSGGAGGREYEGEYEVTPSEEMTVLRTTNKFCSRNIIVNPIPSNYGRIEQQGTILTVF